MKISLYLSVFLLALVTKTLAANVRLQRSPQQYCGSKLVDVMKTLCNTKNNIPIGQKRSEIDSDVSDYKDLEDYNSIDYPFLNKEEMSFMPSRFRRSVKRSIINECCRRPCYLSELKSFCTSEF